MVPILKRGKDGTKPDSYRPVNQPSTYRKLISLIILTKSNPKNDASILPSHDAYRTGKSTRDIVLAHKYLTGSSTKSIQKGCAGIDMSKAFNTVGRKKLIDILRKRGIEEKNVTIIKRLLNQTTLRPKMVQRYGNGSTPTEGPHKEMGHHPDFLLYIWTNFSTKLTVKFEQKHQKDKTPRYTIITMLKENQAPIPRHLEYAHDVDFIDSLEKAQETHQIATKVLEKFNLQVNQSKTEYSIYHKDTDLRKKNAGKNIRWMCRIPKKKTTRKNGPTKVKKMEKLIQHREKQDEHL